MRKDNIEDILKCVYSKGIDDIKDIGDIEVPDMDNAFKCLEEDIRENKISAMDEKYTSNKKWRFIKIGSLAAAAVFAIGMFKYTTLHKIKNIEPSSSNIAVVDKSENEKPKEPDLPQIKDEISDKDQKKDINEKDDTKEVGKTDVKNSTKDIDDSNSNDNIAGKDIKPNTEKNNNPKDASKNKDTSNNNQKDNNKVDDSSELDMRKHTSFIIVNAINRDNNLDFKLPKYIPEEYYNEQDSAACSADKKVIQIVYKNSDDNALRIIEEINDINSCDKANQNNQDIHNSDEELQNVKNPKQDNDELCNMDELYEVEQRFMNGIKVTLCKKEKDFYRAFWNDSKLKYTIKVEKPLIKEEMLKIVEGLQLEEVEEKTQEEKVK